MHSGIVTAHLKDPNAVDRDTIVLALIIVQQGDVISTLGKPPRHQRCLPLYTPNQPAVAPRQRAVGRVGDETDSRPTIMCKK